MHSEIPPNSVTDKLLSALYGEGTTSKEYYLRHQLLDFMIRSPLQMETLPLPSRYAGTRVGDYLLENSGNQKGIYRHQALAAEALDRGEDVLITTSTNSGKTRAFCAEAFHTVMTDPSARVLAFYPLKNLGSDQTNIWKSMAKELNLPASIIGHIDGNVAKQDRVKIIEQSRIILATPDVMHSWAMSNLKEKSVQEFIKNRKLTIIDEADMFDRAFGTNMAFFLRRLQYLQQAMTGDNFTSHRYIGASATLEGDNSRFFPTLIGRPTVTYIGESDNGAPKHERTIIHYDAYGQIENNLNLSVKFALAMLEIEQDKQGIIFFDSRSQVEQATALINEASNGKDTAVAIKAGLTTKEMARIEKLLQSGQAKIVVATSSMEAGIDRDFAWGINVGEPSNKNKLLQRIGRVGRKQSGTFIVLAKDRINNGHRSLSAYLQEEPLETPVLYPENEFTQISQALCLIDETNQLKESKIQLHNVEARYKTAWPRGFIKALDIARSPENHLSGEKNLLVPPKGSKVQYFHTLRHLSNVTFTLAEKTSKMGADRNGYKPHGTCTLDQAISEYPPGAIVYSERKKWRVVRWQEQAGNNHIIIRPYSGKNRTKHFIKQDSSIALIDENLIKGTLRMEKPASDVRDDAELMQSKAFMCLIRGKSSKTVHSFVEYSPETGKHYAYKFRNDYEFAKLNVELNQRDYGPRRHSNISTTGLLLNIGEWIANRRPVGKRMKEYLLNCILDEYCDATNIRRSEIDFVTDPKVYLGNKCLNLENMVYIFDTTSGSLGLSHGLMTHKKHNIDAMLHRIEGKTSATQEAWFLKATHELHKKIAAMEPIELQNLPHQPPPQTPPEGHILVAPPGQFALHEHFNGIQTRVRIIEPTVLKGTPGYYVEAVNRKKHYKPKDDNFVTIDKETRQPVEPLPVKKNDFFKRQETVAISHHFIAATHISPIHTNVFWAMNLETGNLLKQNEENQAWEPCAT